MLCKSRRWPREQTGGVTNDGSGLPMFPGDRGGTPRPRSSRRGFPPASPTTERFARGSRVLMRGPTPTVREQDLFLASDRPGVFSRSMRAGYFCSTNRT